MAPLLYVGDLAVCSQQVTDPTQPVLTQPHATVHACKSPCHQQAVGYTKSLPPAHPHYLTYRRGRDLYLNLIDPVVPLFQRETFWATEEFLAAQPADLPVVLHCNHGRSRAPALALLHLIRRGLSPVPRDDYDGQRAWFTTVYPPYALGAGLALYLRTHWRELLDARPTLPPAA